MFQQAQVNAEQEANDLVNVYRLSAQLEASARDQIKVLTLQYAKNAIETNFLRSMTTCCRHREAFW